MENVTLSKPYIKYGDKKILVLYNPPHLLKNIWNDLKKSDFEINGKMVSWQCIVDFYNFDKTQQIQMAPILEDKHIDLPPFSTMQVNLGPKSWATLLQQVYQH